MHVVDGVAAALRSTAQLPTLAWLTSLFVYESSRVYGDQLASREDVLRLQSLLQQVVQQFFEPSSTGLTVAQVMADTGVFLPIKEPFARLLPADLLPPHSTQRVEACTAKVPWDAAHASLLSALSLYNDTHRSSLSVSLFVPEAAFVAQLARIIARPHQHAVLLGPMDSGQEDLVRLAAFVTGDVPAHTLNRYPSLAGADAVDPVAKFAARLADVCRDAGLHQQSFVLIIPEEQFADQRLCPAMLSCILGMENGYDLFSREERADVVERMRGEVQMKGIDASEDACWFHFLSKVHANVTLVITVNPGTTRYTAWLHGFPRLFSQTHAMFMRDWSAADLVDVVVQTLSTFPPLPEEAGGLSASLSDPVVRANIGHHAALVRSFPPLASSSSRTLSHWLGAFWTFLSQRVEDLLDVRDKSQRAAEYAVATVAGVERWSAELSKRQGAIAQKQESIARVLSQIGQDKHDHQLLVIAFGQEGDLISELSRRLDHNESRLKSELTTKMHPFLDAARASLEQLTDAHITELRSVIDPPGAVLDVLVAVLVLLAPATEANATVKGLTWNAAKRRAFTRVESFMDALKHFDATKLSPGASSAISPYLSNPGFSPEQLHEQSAAAAVLCSWVINVSNAHQVYVDLEPLREATSTTSAQLRSARANVTRLEGSIRELSRRIENLTDTYRKACEEKAVLARALQRVVTSLNLAKQLSSELQGPEKWASIVRQKNASLGTAMGDASVASSMLVYGSSMDEYDRKALVAHIKDTLEESGLAWDTSRSSAAQMLASSASEELWSSLGLPQDPEVMASAAAVVAPQTADPRWRLLVDPEESAGKWLRALKPNMQVTNVGDDGYLHAIQAAAETGTEILLEGLFEAEELDHWRRAQLWDLLSRRGTTQGGRPTACIGNATVELHSDFAMYLHTTNATPRMPRGSDATVNVINFAWTDDGIRDAVLSRLDPTAEQQKLAISQDLRECIQQLNKADSDVIELISSTSGDDGDETARILRELAAHNEKRAQLEKLKQLLEHQKQQCEEPRKGYSPAVEWAFLALKTASNLAARGLNPKVSLAQLLDLVQGSTPQQANIKESVPLSQPASPFSSFGQQQQPAGPTAPPSASTFASFGQASPSPAGPSPLPTFGGTAPPPAGPAQSPSPFGSFGASTAPPPSSSTNPSDASPSVGVTKGLPAQRGTAAPPGPAPTAAPISFHDAVALGQQAALRIRNALSHNHSLFSVMLTLSVLVADGQISHEEHVLITCDRPRSPLLDSGVTWLSKDTWSRVIWLAEKCPAFKELVRVLMDASDPEHAPWKHWFSLFAPEEVPLPPLRSASPEVAAQDSLNTSTSSLPPGPGSSAARALAPAPPAGPAAADREGPTVEPPLEGADGDVPVEGLGAGRLPLATWHLLLAVRFLRPERLERAMLSVVKTVLGEDFVRPSPRQDVLTMLSGRTDRAVTVFVENDNTCGDHLKALHHVALAANINVTSISLGEGSAMRAVEGVVAAAQSAQQSGVLLLRDLQLAPPGWLRRVDALLTSMPTTSLRVFCSATLPQPLSVEGSALLTFISHSHCVVLQDTFNPMEENLKYAMSAIGMSIWNAHSSSRYRASLFSVCLLYAVLIARRQFGPRGWRGSSTVDAADVLAGAQSLLLLWSTAGNNEVPWSHIKEAMNLVVLAHVVAESDRRLCDVYLEALFCDTVRQDVLPGFSVPSTVASSAFPEVLSAVDSLDPQMVAAMNSLQFLGLSSTPLAITTAHVHARRFPATLSLASGRKSTAKLELTTREQLIIEAVVQHVRETLPDPLASTKVEVVDSKDVDGADEFGPFMTMFEVEANTLNSTLQLVLRSLELIEGLLHGKSLGNVDGVHQLAAALKENLVPEKWLSSHELQMKGECSLPLESWLESVQCRRKQLQGWNDGAPWNTVLLGGLANPCAYAQAIRRRAARKHECALDKLVVLGDVHEVALDGIHEASKKFNGTLVYGLSLEGGTLQDDKIKSASSIAMFTLPVIALTAVPVEEVNFSERVHLPLYSTDEHIVEVMSALFLHAGHLTSIQLSGAALRFDPLAQYVPHAAP